MALQSKEIDTILAEFRGLRRDVKGGLSRVETEIKADIKELRKDLSSFQIQLVETGGDIDSLQRDVAIQDRQIDALQVRTIDHENRVYGLETSFEFHGRSVGEIKDKVRRAEEKMADRLWELSKVVLPIAALLAIIVDKII